MSSQNTPRMTHFYILTLDLPGRAAASVRGELAVHPGTRRMEVFDYLRGQITEQNPEMAGANPVYFVLEPLTV